MEFAILGPLAVRHDGAAVEIAAPKLRALLIRLLVDLGNTVPVDRLIDDLWDGAPPAGALASLRAYVSNLRRGLEVAGDQPLITRSGGYALELPPHLLDANRFAEALHLASGQRAAGDPEAALAALERALGMWRGPALADVADTAFAQPTLNRLEELRRLAREERVASLLALGRHDLAIPDLESMIATDRLRERPYRQLALALYRAGRSAEALQVHRELRELLADELGLDPSPRFEELVARILRHDPSLEPGPTPPTPDPAAAGSVDIETGAAAGVAIPSGSAQEASRIVGRERERADLRATIARLRDRTGGILLVHGEAGIGKTTLLDDLASSARQVAAVHVGQCPEQPGAPAFWPWQRALGSVARAAPAEAIRGAATRAPAVVQLLPELADEVRVAVPATTDLPSARFALYDAVASFLSSIAADRPQVIVLDDLHWADEASLELLAFVGEQLAAAPVLLVGSYRSTPADRPQALDAALARLHRRPELTEVPLGGLSREEVAEAIVASGRQAEPDEVAALHDRTGGNPFFVMQLVRFLGEDVRDLTDAAIPTGVRHVIARRLQLLPVTTQSLLEAAAVAGRSFDPHRVARTCDVSVQEVLDELDLAHAHGLVEPQDRSRRQHRFVHALIRETLRDGLSPNTAARLHLATARALDSSGDAPVEELAEHLWLSGELAPRDETVQVLLRAADAATAALAYERAETLLRRALDVVVGDGDITLEVDVRVRLANLISRVTGWSSEDLATIASRVWSMADEVGLRPDLLPLWHLLWTGLTSRGEMARSREVATELLRRAQVADDELFVATAQLLLGYLDVQAGRDLPAALERIVAARDVLDQQPDAHLATTPEHLGVTARLVEVSTRGFLGDDATLQACEDLLAYADGVDRPFSRVAAAMFAGWAAATHGDLEAARTWTGAGIELCDRFGFAGARHLLVPVDAWVHLQLGAEPHEQVARIAAAVAALDAGRGVVTARWWVLYADALLHIGDTQKARQALDGARRFVETTGEHVYDPLIERRMRDVESVETTGAVPTPG
jgi:DNA-binding SARP family transcriptional activator